FVAIVRATRLWARWPQKPFGGLAPRGGEVVSAPDRAWLSFVDSRRPASFNAALASSLRGSTSTSLRVLSTANLAFVETLYGRYLEDPDSVREDFRRYFEAEHPRTANVRIGPSFSPRSLFDPAGSVAATNGAPPPVQKAAAVHNG